MTETTDATLRETSLAALHRELGARMVPFAGYAMPVQYRDGIMAEHRHTRAAAGLFDVSHMGQAQLRGPDYATVAAALETVTPGDFQNLAPGRMRYSLLMTPEGTIVDDIMVARPAGKAGETGLDIVFNAARVAVDEAFVGTHLPTSVRLELPPHRAMLALQGPKAIDVMLRHAAVGEMRFMDTLATTFDGIPVAVTRSGYTGEDGFEIYLAAADAEAIARTLLAEPEVRPIGLGARDSLRLEAGLPLYGHDIDETTTPVEADLAFAISPRRRAAADFPGAARILDELQNGTRRKRVGLRIDGKLPAREGAAILDDGGAAVGKVTSGGFGPTVDAPVAMGYVDAAHAALGVSVAIDVRGRTLATTVSPMPFVAHRYRRRSAG
ncbi:MAG: glycine cleavage system aminomethyltransferase GcvT [Bauldia sp.]|nr:glycine cleavage system aminomethyltransferase GcvT [Bauldia sp.]